MAETEKERGSFQFEPAEIIPDHERHQVNYKVVSLDENGEPVYSQEAGKPSLGGYLYRQPHGEVQGRFGNAGYCPTATWRHHQHAEAASSEFPQLVFFNSIEVAVALDFAPCQHCWLTEDEADGVLLGRWLSYQTACEIQEKEPITPPPVIEQRVLPLITAVEDQVLAQRVENRLAKYEYLDEEQGRVLAGWLQVEEICRAQEVDCPALLPSVARLLAENEQCRKTDEETIRSFIHQELTRFAREPKNGPTPFPEGIVNKSLLTKAKAVLVEGKSRIEFQEMDVKFPEVIDDLIDHLFFTGREIPLHGLERAFGETDDAEIQAFFESARGDQVLPDQVGVTFKKMAEMILDADPDQLRNLTSLGTFLYERAGVSLRHQLNKTVWESLTRLKEHDRHQSAEQWIRWSRSRYKQDQRGVVQPGETVSPAQAVTPPDFFSDLQRLLLPKDFDAVGRFLKARLPREATEISTLRHRNWPDRLVSQLPWSVLEELADCYAEIGYFYRTSTGKLKLKKAGIEAAQWGWADIQNAQVAARFLTPGLTDAEPKPIESLADVAALMEEYREQIRVEERVIETGRPTARVMYLNEVDLGHKDTDVDFLMRVIGYLKDLAPEKRPDVVVVSSIIQGGFHFTEKVRRMTLAGQLASVDQQFKAARLLIDEFLGLGIKVIVNTGPDDARLWHDYAIEAMRMMNQVAGPLADRQKSHVPYYGVNQMQAAMKNWDLPTGQDKTAWDFHLRFQQQVVYPYCLRAGRRLRSADEIAKATGGQIRQEEYLLLLQAWDQLKSGRPVSPVCQQVLAMDKIPFPGKVFTDFAVTDNVNLVMKTLEDEEFRHLVLNQAKFSPQPRYQSPADVLLALVGHLEAEGLANFDVVVGQNQSTGLTVQRGDRLAVLVPALKRPDLFQKGSVMNAAGDPSWRLHTTRRVVETPGVRSYEHFADGRLVIANYSGVFMDKAKLTTQREVVVNWGDVQIGSVSARPDLFVKSVSMLADLLESGYQVTLIIGGDIIHGRNYKGSDHENKRTGLISVDGQMIFTEFMITEALKRVSPEHWHNLKVVRIAPGNHELNSGYRDYGASHSFYLVSTFERQYALKGVRMEEGQVRLCSNVVTDRGESFPSPTIFEEVADYGLFSRHQLIERGSKGNGGLPVYQGVNLVQGLGSYMSETDVAVSFHWHHLNELKVGDKWFIITPALAGMSGYEYHRGFRPQIGGARVYLGGGEVPELELLETKYLHQYQIPDGDLCDEALADTYGFVTDPDFDPLRHGFTRFHGQSQSGLQKYLHYVVDGQLWHEDARITTS